MNRKEGTKKVNNYDIHTATAATTAVAVSQAASGSEKAKRFGRVASVAIVWSGCGAREMYIYRG